MIQTFANLPEPINAAITQILASQPTPEWVQRSIKLHERYMNKQIDHAFGYIEDQVDALAYLALRTPATYAQIFGSFSHITDTLMDFKPKTMLDIGSGPGTGVWAAKQIWDSLEEATCLDRERSFLTLGREISNAASLSVKLSLQQGNAAYIIENDTTKYDIVLLANMLGELDTAQRDHLIGSAYNHCKGIMVIVEPGTPEGSAIVYKAAKSLSHEQILAPYSNNTLIEDTNHWLHFPQRFIRPEFQRRVRQHMRDSSLMASDWEEAKYAYVAIGNNMISTKPWGRCVGAPTLYKGYLQIPIMTTDGMEVVKVMKRHKQQYLFAKKLKWGESIEKKEDLLITL
ncbi:MAG: hypothetical protein KBD46_01340 [Candidatus Levybacteria bacterium]|nr:hypothetical protein [Candidatus Levybacteria bacterium]